MPCIKKKHYKEKNDEKSYKIKIHEYNKKSKELNEAINELISKIKE